MHKNDILSLPILASALGRKHGVRVEITAEGTASTDGRTIYLPFLGRDLDNTKKTRVLLRGYIDHEAAHIRWTVIPKEVTTLFNCLEDVRVEKLMTEHYVGSARNLEDLVSTLQSDEGAFPPPESSWPDMAVVGSYIISTLRVNVLSQTPLMNVRERAREMCVKRFGYAKINALDTYLNTFSPTSSEDCMRMEKEIRELLFSGESPESPVGQDSSPQGTHPSESGSPEQDSSGDSSPDLLRRYDLGATLGDAIASLSRAALVGSEYLVVTKGPAKMKRASESLIQDAIAKADFLAERLRNILVDHLQRIGMARRQVARQGVALNTRKIARATVDSRIFRGFGRTRQLSAAIHVILDRSESMRSMVLHKMEELRHKYMVADTVTLALLKAAVLIPQIKMEVVCFPADKENPKLIHVMQSNDQKHITTTDPLFTLPDGSTPLHVPLYYVRDHIAIAEPNTDRHVVIVITDGEPDDPQRTHAAVSEVRKLGVEVYCLGLPGVGGKFIKECFSPHNSRILTDIDRLPRYLRQLFLTKVFS